MREKIIVISGDPNSINSEIIFKSWKKIRNNLKQKIYFISNYNLIKKQFKKLGYHLKLSKVDGIYDNVKTNGLKIIDVDLKFKNEFNVSRDLSSKFIKNCLNLGHELGMNKDIKGIINCAISKVHLNDNKGVTEFLAKKCNLKKNTEVMLISNSKFSVSPLTTHINISKVSKNLKKSLIINKVKTIINCYKKYFNKRPKIGVLGLNPHNSEYRKNSEELKIIIPALNNLRRKGINLKGPLVPDTVFINQYKKYDIILGMYHDQVLTPFKALFNFEAINITLGLKYLRVSPDHGVAKEIIGKNKANPKSLIKCFEFIDKFGK